MIQHSATIMTEKSDRVKVSTAAAAAPGPARSIALSLWAALAIGCGDGLKGDAAGLDGSGPSGLSDGEADGGAVGGAEGGAADGSGDACAEDADCAQDRGERCVEGACVADPDWSPGADADEENAARETEGFGAGEPTAIGAPIGELCGVVARQNGPDPGAVANGSGQYGYEHQCTEYAYRFLCEAYGLCTEYDRAAQGYYGDARMWYTNTTNTVLAGLSRYDNGGLVPPAPGDVLAKGGSEWGHVAVVSTVDLEAGVVSLVEQNCFGCSHAARLSSSGGRYTLSGGWQGWMREEGAWDANCATSVGCSGDLLSVEVEGASLHVVADASCAAGLDALSLVVGSTTVWTTAPSGPSTRIDATIDLSAAGAPEGRQALGLWARADGADAGVLLDSTAITWEDCGGEAVRCVGGHPTQVDGCGVSLGRADTCSAAEVCVESGAVDAACETLSEDCADRRDNDGDGDVDCEDSDCLGTSTCAPTIRSVSCDTMERGATATCTFTGTNLQAGGHWFIGCLGGITEVSASGITGVVRGEWGCGCGLDANDYAYRAAGSASSAACGSAFKACGTMTGAVLMGEARIDAVSPSRIALYTSSTIEATGCNLCTTGGVSYPWLGDVTVGPATCSATGDTVWFNATPTGSTGGKELILSRVSGVPCSDAAKDCFADAVFVF